MNCAAPWIDPPDEYPKLTVPRQDYLDGTWAYAYGKNARTHPRYKDALRLAGNHARRNKIPSWAWWIRNWSDVEAVLDGCFFDIAAGYDVIDFCQYVHHFEGEWAGEVFEPADWQVYDIFMPLFGWKRANPEYNPAIPKSRRFIRRFRRAYIEIPKKNGKTFMCSVLAIYLLDYDGEQGAKVFSGAVDRDQASMVYDAAAAMVAQSPELADHLKCIDSRKRITCRETNSFYMSLSSEVSSKEGKNIHGMVFDELHVYRDRRMWSTMKFGGAIRQQPIQIAITTAGVYDPTSLGWEQHELALKIRDAVGDAHKLWSNFAYVCNLTDEEQEDWTNPELWKKTNPSWGISIRASEMAESCAEAQENPADKNDFLRYRLDIWTQQLNAWMNMTAWDECAGTYDESDLAGETCYAGLDCSLSEDVTGLTLWFPPQKGRERHRLLCWAWCPEEAIPKFDEQYNGLYSLWRSRGYLIATPGPTIRQDYIREKLLELQKRFTIRTLGYDKAFAENLALQLQSDGFDVGSFGQGFPAMNEPTTLFMDLVKNGGLEHPNNPVLNWHVSNCQSIKDGGDRIRLVKNWGQQGKAQIRFKIDLAVASIMALGTSLLDPYPVEAEMGVVWI